MSRSALVLSLALHTGLLAVVGLGWSKIAVPADPGVPGVGISFLPEGATGSLLTDAAPAEDSSEALSEPEAELESPPNATPIPSVEFSPSVDPSPIAQLSPPSPPSALPGIASTISQGTTTKRDRFGQSKRAGIHAGGRTVGVGTGNTGSGPGDGGQGFVPPRYLMRYKPPYPEAARTHQLQGTVILMVSIDKNGRVISVQLRQSCGHSLLDRTALEAVRSWRFEPARQQGTPVAAENVEVPVRFQFAG